MFQNDCVGCLVLVVGYLYTVVDVIISVLDIVVTTLHLCNHRDYNYYYYHCCNQYGDTRRELANFLFRFQYVLSFNDIVTDCRNQC